MFTINISISAENLQTSVSNFIEHMKPLGHVVLNCKLDVEGGVAEMLFTTPSPTDAFVLIERWASEDIPVPAPLQDIYFSETIYSLHTMPKDVSQADIVRLINHNINFGCIVRRDNYRYAIISCMITRTKWMKIHYYPSKRCRKRLIFCLRRFWVQNY